MITLLLSMMPSALAWEAIGAWGDSPPTIHFRMGVDEEETVPAGASRAAIEGAMEAWNSANCAGLQFVLDDEPLVGNPGLDFVNGIYFNDPNGKYGSGVHGVAVPWGTTGSLFTLDDRPVHGFTDVDIVINDDVAFVTDGDILAGDCDAELSLQTVIAHELGHAAGLGHCPPDVCPLMTEHAAPLCEIREPGWDEVGGIEALYGGNPGWTCQEDGSDYSSARKVRGLSPLDVTCALDGRDPGAVAAVAWDLGNGSHSSDLQPTATYEAGEYEIRLCSDVETAECGVQNFCSPHIVEIYACPDETPDFVAEAVGGLAWRLRPTMSHDVYDCASDPSWVVTGIDGFIVESLLWEPVIDFPAAGLYEATLTVHHDTLGEVVVTHLIDITDEPAPDFDLEEDEAEGKGCGCAATTWPAALWLGLPLLALRRRTRKPRA